jgi:nucleoside-diphosphate-sugar epimerase
VARKVLVLGASGFIGKHLLNYLDVGFEVRPLRHRSQNLVSLLEEWVPDVVINCSASTNYANFSDSVEANLLYQMNFLRLIWQRRGTPFKWIQLGSYYELQIEFGRNDNYSLHKALCRTLLEQAHCEGMIGLTTVFLPHVFGSDERPDRIISSLIGQLNKGEEVTISSGEQFLPILAVEDACQAISKSIENDQVTCSATPIWYGRVSELASLIHQRIGKGLVLPNPARVSVDAKYPQVVFPPRVSGWEPSILFDEFLSSIGVTT